MATYYVDLSSSGTGHAGTQGDPLSAAQFNGMTRATHTFYMRGSASIDIYDFGGCTVLPWDLQQYGPWRIHSTLSGYAYTPNTIVHGGIFESTQNDGLILSGAPLTFYNCYFIGSKLYLGSDSGTSRFYGCTFVATTESASSAFDCRFENCVIKTSSITTYAQYANTAINCAFGPVVSPSNFTLTSCQTGWTPTVFPAWNAPKQDFYTGTLFAGINTPPQPGLTPYTGYTTDLWGNARTGIGAAFMGSLVAPTWVSNPIITSFNSTTARVTATIDSDGIVYGVLLTRGATTPSAAQVKAGTDALGSPALHGSGSFTTNASGYFDITPVVPLNQYDLYCVAEGVLLQSNPYGPVQYNAPDLTAPSWAVGSPSVTGTTENTATFSVQINEAGNVYFVALPSGATAPTSAEVKAGTGSGGASPVNSGSTAVTANTPASLTSTGLVRSTTYDFYFVAEDSIPNLQATPVLRTITTPDTTAPSWVVGSPSVTGTTENTATFSVQINEAGNVYFVALPSGATAPTSAEVKAGTGSGGASPVNSGNTAVTANTPASLTSTGLIAGAIYDFYLVAEDSIPNLQAAPVLKTASTQSIPYREITENSTDEFKGMPSKANFTGGSLQYSDTNLGNPFGDINSNAAGHNPVLDVLPRDEKLGNLNGNVVDNSAGNNPVAGSFKKWFSDSVINIPKWLFNQH